MAIPPPEGELAARCAAVEWLLLDVDGVLTDGAIIINDQGVETKHFHVRDGSALALWRRAGKRAAILSGRSAPVVAIRAKELGIDPVIQGRHAKAAAYREFLESCNLESNQVCYVGDDLLDLPVLLAAGVAACPADALPEVRGAVHFIAPSAGGHGAVRDVIELLLRGQGVWDALVGPFLQPATSGAVSSESEVWPRQ
jgi:3-deoxy-D-manno-octulosonate 8-phosphate phosphatase (KDO 8-P phosphatase)